MKYCKWCESQFEIPHVIFDGTEVCPECGSEQIVEAVRCMVCNRNNSDIVCVKTEAVKKLCDQWRRNGLGWQTEELPSKIPGCTNVILNYGSSTFDRAQMARFIDSLVQDCQAVGIETMEENNLRSLLESWNA